MPTIGALLTTALIHFGVSSTAAGIIAPIILTVAGLILTVLLAPKPPKPEDGHFGFQQPVPFRIWAVGTTRIAGAVMLKEEQDGPLYIVQACGGHRFAEWHDFWINDDKVQIVAEHDKGGNVAGLGDGRYGDGVISLFYRLGLPTETSYSTEFPGGGWFSEWTDDARGDGQASIGMLCRSAGSDEISRRYPVIPPSPSATWDTAIVWDPRDEDQDPDDPSTWGFSRNAILCLLWFECFNEFGPQRDYHVAVLPVIDQWMGEADICDEAVPLKAGGTEPRYEVGGWVTTEQDPDVGRQAILAAGDIRTYERGDGALVPWCGKFREPTITLIDSDIAGFYLPTEIPNEEAVNSLRVTFTFPDAGYTTGECDPFEDEDDQIARGRKLVTTAAYNWVGSFSQARRLAKREFYRLQSSRRGTLDLRFSAINAAYERWITIDSNGAPARLSGVIENLGSQLSLSRGGMIFMGFVGTDEEIDDWDEDVDEGNAPPVPVVISDSALQVPTNVNLVFELLGGQYNVSVSFDAPTTGNLDLAYEIHWRVADDGTSNPGPWSANIHYGVTPAVGGTVELSLTGVPLNTDVEVEVRSEADHGGFSGWSATETVSTDTSGVAPFSPSITSHSGGSGQWTITYKAPNSANFYGARVYSVITGGGFGIATDQFGLLTGSPNSSKTKTKTGVSSGTYDLYVTAENSDGANSSAAGPVTVTVT